MKCPHCHAEIPDASKFCTYCGKNIPAVPQPTAAPQQPYTQTSASSYSYGNGQPYAYSAASAYPSAKQGKSGGEIAAIVTAVIVSILSVLAAFIIFAVYTARLASNVAENTNLDDLSSGFGGLEDYGNFGDYGIDDFSDEDSLDHFFDFYSALTGEQSQYPAETPAEEHTAISFDDYLQSFSNGYIDTTYDVELDEAYRGEAALKLLEGANLPDYSDDQEVYLVKFKLTVTEQETEAFVNPTPTLFTVAYPYQENGMLSSQYTSLTYLGYKDANQLLKKGESGERWMAFVVDKTDERPLISWDKYDGEFFRYSKQAVSSAAGLEAGAALESDNGVSSDQ